jgi:hypothetical protein
MAFLTYGKATSEKLSNRQTADYERIIGTSRSRPQATGPEEFVTKRLTVSVTVQLRRPDSRDCTGIVAANDGMFVFPWMRPTVSNSQPLSS